MRFEVPQFIEIEDKIFGPFTWKQFVFLAGGVGFAAVLFLTTNFFIFVLFGLPIGGVAVLLAFYKVNNRPFSRFLESMLNYITHARLYLWKKSGSGIYHGQPEIDEAQAVINAYIPKHDTANLTSLSRKLELKAIQKEN